MIEYHIDFVPTRFIAGIRTACALALLALSTACGIAPDRDGPPVDPGSGSIDLSNIPDAEPRVEPRSRYGNPPSYVALGKRYYTSSKSRGVVERGVASWYGKKFHGRRTSSGDTYDMYAMTAAHRSLPLPTYARITNLENGRQVVVRINDRGPFVKNRIVDLSFVAAHRLGMVEKGTAQVLLETIDPVHSAAAPRMAEAPVVKEAIVPLVPSARMPRVSAAHEVIVQVAPAPQIAAGPAAHAAAAPALRMAESRQAKEAIVPAPTATQPPVAVPIANGRAASLATPPSPTAYLDASQQMPLSSKAAVASSRSVYVQVGAFSQPANAERLSSRLVGLSAVPVRISEGQSGGRSIFRVRLGPLADSEQASGLAAELADAGVNGAHVIVE